MTRDTVIIEGNIPRRVRVELRDELSRTEHPSRLYVVPPVLMLLCVDANWFDTYRESVRAASEKVQNQSMLESRYIIATSSLSCGIKL